VKAVERELRLRHLTVDEAVWRLDQYLSDAFTARMYSVRIIHGKGTGQLRCAVHALLSEHPLVKSFRLGDCSEGDYGVTIVELMDQ
jgi:DNA mismatch repair protein MutS2